MATQRRFSTMGDCMFKIANKLAQDQKLCRLLSYQTRNPFSEDLPNVDGADLINKQIQLVPRIFDDHIETMSYLIVVFKNFVMAPNNGDFKISTIDFEIICPYTEWLLDNASLRPFLMMNEIDTLFNRAKVTGLGELTFSSAEAIIANNQMGGYRMSYKVYEFN